MRPIDADALLEVYADTPGVYLERLSMPILHVKESIRYAPTIDAEIVVRCKDCVHNYGLMHDSEETPYYPDDIVCEYWKSDGLCEYDFCSRGIRRGTDDR